MKNQLKLFGGKHEATQKLNLKSFLFQYEEKFYKLLLILLMTHTHCDCISNELFNLSIMRVI